jgi:hypothetical protein
MKYQTITKWNEDGRTYLDFEQFFTEQEALRHAKASCHYREVVIESLVLDESDEVLHQVRKGEKQKNTCLKSSLPKWWLLSF